MRRKLLIAGGALTGMLVIAVVAAVGFLNYLTMRTPGEYFDSDGARLYYTVQGEGEPVVLIHGLAAQADINWRRNGVVDRLAKEFKVITFDLRGHGLSEVSHDPAFYGVQMVEDVPRLLDHLGIEKAHVAGYSLGGFITLKLLTLHPDRVQSAALCAAGWKDPADPEELLSPYSPPPPVAAAMPAVRPAYASVLPAPWQPLHLAFGISDLRGYVRERLGDPKGWKASKKNILELGVSRDALETINTPIVCFMGSADGLRPYGDALRDNLPGVEYVKLDGANHITTAMRGEFKDRLQEFFRQHPMTDGVVAAN